MGAIKSYQQECQEQSIDTLKAQLDNETLLDFVNTAQRGEVSINVLYPLGEKYQADEVLWSVLLEKISIKNQIKPPVLNYAS